MSARETWDKRMDEAEVRRNRVIAAFDGAASESLPLKDEYVADVINPSGAAEKMSEITREEFNARMETIEVKMDSRIESVSAKIDSFMAVQAERDKRMEAIVSGIATSHDQIKTGIGSMKTAMVITAISTVLAIVIGVASFNATLTSNMFSAFQAGKTEAAASQPSAAPSAKQIQSLPASPPPAAPSK